MLVLFPSAESCGVGGNYAGPTKRRGRQNFKMDKPMIGSKSAFDPLDATTNETSAVDRVER